MAAQQVYGQSGVERAHISDHVNFISFDPAYLRIKRLVDVIFCLLVLIPLCLITAVLFVVIPADTPGPAVFRQKRVGQHGVEFELLKFRSMYTHCDDTLHRAAIARYMEGQVLNEHDDAGRPYKLGDDPRITRLGKILRKTCIDELPQFWNVLTGDLTLVGPRPPLPYEVNRYSERDLLRLSGKPGLTGPWQVYGRSRVTFQDMVEMDIAYLRRQAIWYDLWLIFRTIPVMLRGDGAA